ncbi:hypothetical protein LR69_03855 [Geobacillus sp. BCO2]|nr:hypothetical protein LR69_03855 [Geobacillus sp. BCO2]
MFLLTVQLHCLICFYHFLSTATFKFSFYVLFVFLISWLSKETFYSFVGIAILSFFMFPGLNNRGIIPSGLNSMAYLLTNDSIYRISTVLFLWNVFAIVFLLYVFFQTRSRFLKRSE